MVTRDRHLVLLALLALLGVAARAAGAPPAPPASETFPVELWAGAAAEASPRPGLLPDLPFSPERGHGFVGGRVERLNGPATLLGGEEGWPAAWREGVEKYSFRVPRGEYLVELAFLETDVAQPGLRVFDVFAEDRELFPRVDIAALAGDFAWLRLRGLVEVYDGWLDLRFVSATAERPPRVSCLRLSRREAGRGPAPTPAAPAAPRLEAAGGPGRVVLRWEAPAGDAIAGYGVFRAGERAGPYESLTESPVLVPWFEDASAPGGEERFYKVTALTVDGGQGPFSEPVSATAFRLHELGLKVYELSVQPEDLRRLLVRRDPPVEVPAQLLHLGATYFVFLSCDSRPDSWGRKKSFQLTLDVDRNRSFQKRRALILGAGADDPTFLRERLGAEAAAALGLAAPVVQPVALVLGGRFLGLYHDIEVVDGRFLSRARLDATGLLVRLTDADHLRPDWSPGGEKVGRGGNLMGLTEFVHEINLLGEGEMDRYFADRFYLDRYLAARALAAARGDLDEPLAGRFLLRDARNGKWEFLRQEGRSGDWGLDAPGLPAAPPAPEEARRLLLGRSLQAGGASGGWSVLESRFLQRPGMRTAALDRTAAVIAGELAPARFDALVDAARAEVEKIALHDPLVVLSPSRRAAFLAGPARLKESHRARVEALERAIRAERGEPPPALVLNEVCFPSGAGSAGGAWVEIANRSAAAVDASRWFLTDDPSAPRRRPLAPPGPAAPALPPGGFLVVELGGDRALRAGPGGGLLALYRVPEGEGGAPDRAPRLEDLLVYDRQTPGFGYGRLDGAPGGWGHLRRPTPAAPNEGPALAAPTHEFRQGVERDKTGAVTLWIRVGAGGTDAEPRPAAVSLRYREDGKGDGFDTVSLACSDKLFRYEVSLESNAERGRMAYYFVAASEAGIERAYPLPAPELTYVLPVLPRLRINEVLPRPRREPGSPGEFIEIYNVGDRAVPLDGMFLSDSRRNSTKWRIPAGVEAPPRGFAVFHASGLGRGNETSFRLSNSGEFLGLFGRMEEGNLLIDSIAFRGMRPGESWGRTKDGGTGFRVWKDPTPGARNLPKIPPELLGKRPEAGAPPEEPVPAEDLATPPEEPVPPEPEGEPDDGADDDTEPPGEDE